MLYALLLSGFRTSVKTCENGLRIVPEAVWARGVRGASVLALAAGVSGRGVLGAPSAGPFPRLACLQRARPRDQDEDGGRARRGSSVQILRRQHHRRRALCPVPSLRLLPPRAVSPRVHSARAPLLAVRPPRRAVPAALPRSPTLRPRSGHQRSSTRPPPASPAVPGPRSPPFPPPLPRSARGIGPFQHRPRAPLCACVRRCAPRVRACWRGSYVEGRDGVAVGVEALVKLEREELRHAARFRHPGHGARMRGARCGAGDAGRAMRRRAHNAHAQLGRRTAVSRLGASLQHARRERTAQSCRRPPGTMRTRQRSQRWRSRRRRA